MKNKVISEKKAWDIITEFVDEIIKYDKENTIAIYAIGSLGGGYYRPGKSDIDTAIIVSNDATLDEEKINKIASKYHKKYNIPKGFGAILFKEDNLYPPYNINDELVLEIVRLKVQGKVTYGNYNLDSVPMPSKNDLIEEAIHFEKWCNKEYGKTMFQKLNLVGAVNTILIHLKRFLMIEKDIFELNKFKVIAVYCENNPPLINDQVFKIINNIFHRTAEITNKDLIKLKIFGEELRNYMNKRLLNI